MKKLAAVLALWVMLAVPALADMGDEGPEPVIPQYDAASVWLGEAVQFNGIWYVPLMVANDYLRNIRSVFGWGAGTWDLETTGTLQTANPNPSLQGHLNGNYWPHLVGATVSSVAGDPTPTDGPWTLDVQGAWDLPYNGGSDCSSLPYPHQTSGVLCYLRFVGEGTVRFSRDKMFSGNTCNLPAITYIRYNAGSQVVQVPPPEQPGGGGGGGGGTGTCGGDPNCIEGLTTGEEAPAKATKPRTTWASIKALYR